MIVCFGEALIDCLPNNNVIGGAPFNVYTHLNRFHLPAHLITALGNDTYGEIIKDFVQQEKFKKTYIQENNYKTGIVTVKFNDKEPEYTIEVPCSWQYINTVPELNSAEIIVFGSLATYFEESRNAFTSLLQQNSKAITVCDLNIRLPFFDKNHAEFCLKHTNILKLNEDESAILMTYFKCSSENELTDYLFNEFPIEICLITKGIKGISIHTPADTYISTITPLPLDLLKDPIGAGDAFTSRFCYGLLKKQNLIENTKASSKFATEICKSQGAIPATKDWYQNFIN